MPRIKKPYYAEPFHPDPDYSYIKPGDDYAGDDKKKIKLACGNASGLSLPVSGIPVWQVVGISSPRLTTGIVTLDTSNMVDPAVKIDFSGIINFLINQQQYANNGGLLLSVDFQLSKVCAGDRIPLATWNYQKSVHLDNYIPAQPQAPASAIGFGLQVDFRESFNFSWCECQPCPACCTYVVEIVNVYSYQIESASITNTNITAMAVGC